jgi:DNA-binding transcriptional MerR regulator
VGSSRVDDTRGPVGRQPAEAPTDEGFRGPQVCSVVGITYRQLDYWARTGLLRPSIADANGSGSQRRYSYGDVLELKVIKRLLDAGLKLRQARQAVECLRGDLGVDLASAQLVLAGTRSVLAQSDGEVVDLLAGGQGVFNILPLSGVVSELDAAIVEIRGQSGAPVPSTHPAAGYVASAERAVAGEVVKR